MPQIARACGYSLEKWIPHRIGMSSVPSPRSFKVGWNIDRDWQHNLRSWRTSFSSRSFFWKKPGTIWQRSDNHRGNIRWR